MVDSTRSTLTPQQALDQVAAAVARSLRVAWVEVATVDLIGTRGRPESGVRVDGFPGGPGCRSGSCRGRHGHQWGSRATDTRLLATLAGLAALVVRAATHAESVAESRHRIVAAREEERRRIGRNLHDELGPTIASLTMQLGAVRTSSAPSPTRRGAARPARGGVPLDPGGGQEAGPRPAAADFGPAGADRGAAAGGGRPRAGSGAGRPRRAEPPAEVEVAAFRIGQQALANVAAHASVDRARLTVAEEDGEVVVEVVDRGRGLLQSTVGGIGVSSMRERAEDWTAAARSGPDPAGGPASSLACRRGSGPWRREAAPRRRPGPRPGRAGR